MKILVVTSEVTFVPGNYNHFLEGLFRELQGEKDLSIDLVILKNNSPVLTLKGLALGLMGARNIGFSLIKNTIKAAFKDRTATAKKHDIRLHFFDNPNSPDFLQFVKNHQTDLLINARTRFIYKSKILKLPRLGAINIHHGLLPEFRGTMCDLWALYNDRPTGFSIHVMEKKIDNGAIIRRIVTSTPTDSNLRKSFARLIEESSKIEGIEMAKVVKMIKETQKIPIEQDNISTKTEYTKNPDFFAIRKMLQKGIEL
ncbi:hypothetical protein DOM21_09490 [Bacteriovorax stolpii]|uniref:Uncharacterized protein n=1 Tax=Bacteriovorax stolpii TaxID=960 RepID=A0A2K9NS43_BACTC|nr:formyltransferase family protein [Bacteriovorax stolpii]AUN98340.1 hypothetical protein C0V70_09525 [Bacteriovorax stolpii]QDK41679.1 hypothetical protein DOM21_09490 [Bacteriovorax stolpii]TDP52264.1 formyl transferase-like protein [Bacteriovorax stolpii]